MSRRVPAWTWRAAALAFAGLAGAGCGATVGAPVPVDAASSMSVATASASPTPTQTPSPTPTPTPTSTAAVYPASQWYSQAIGSPQASQGKVIYLTFDDGPAAATPQVLNLLSKYGAKATFFVIGRQVPATMTTLQRVASEGHAIGNHTWNHKDLTKLPGDDLANELSQTMDASPMIGKCMRPPYGAINDTVNAEAQRQGLAPVLWTADSRDWSAPSAARIVADAKAGTAPGAVILMHDGGGNRQHTLDALKELLPYWANQGYQIKPIPACVRN